MLSVRRAAPLFLKPLTKIIASPRVVQLSKVFAMSLDIHIEVPLDLANYYQIDYYGISSLRQLQTVTSKSESKINTVLRFAASGHFRYRICAEYVDDTV